MTHPNPSTSWPGDGRWLLPEGIEELLPREAAVVERLRRELLDLCNRWGYDLVIPPLVEYCESLLIGLGHDLELQTFTLTDQLSGRLLGIRPDITPQVARMDAHSLRSEGPARLCYAGSVLHTRARSPLASRSPIRLGAELYGDASLAADVEVVSLMLEMLRVAGLQSVTLDLGHVGIFRGLMRQADLDEQTREALFALLQDKAESSIHALLDEAGIEPVLAARLGRLATLNGDRSVIAEARQLFADAPAEVGAALDALDQVADAVTKRSPGVNIHFDLCELHGYHYHTGLVFAAYVPGQGEAVANGGRYDDIGGVFGRARPATGFNTDLRSLLNLACTGGDGVRRGIFVPDVLAESAWAEVSRLREAGERVVVGLPGQTRTQSACDRELRAGDDGAWRIESI